MKMLETWASLDARRRGLALLVVAAMLLAVGGWGASLMIESPREAAANASAPPPSLIAVPVEKRRVGEEIVTRGTVRATHTVEAVTELVGAGARRSLVSAPLPSPGTVVKSGTVVAEISGRPVVALQGKVPAYRDLGPGDTGPDVAQLNKALAAAGLGTRPRARVYDDATRSAVASLFEAAGHSSNGSLRAGEVVFVSALPASVARVRGSLGDPATEASVEIASGDLAIEVTLSGGEAALVADASEVMVSSEILGETIRAAVAPSKPSPSAAGSSGSEQSNEEEAGEPGSGEQGAGGSGAAEGAESGGARVQVVPETPLDRTWAGQDVKVRFVSVATEEEVLAVPVTAVVADAAGESEVVVVARGASTVGDADPRRVRVTIGAVGGGWAQVLPRDGEKLAPGDLVQLSALTAAGER